jgi:RecA-family ATPase
LISLHCQWYFIFLYFCITSAGVEKYNSLPDNRSPALVFNSKQLLFTFFSKKENIMRKISFQQLLSLSGSQEFLVDKILPKGTICALVGSSEAGKTQFALQLALTIAAGETSFVGLRCHPRHKRVVVIATEDTPVNIKSRVLELLKGTTGCTDLDILFYSEVESDPVEVLSADLASKPADIVIVDTWLDFFNEDLNQNNDVRGFLIKYAKIAEKHNCCILFIHHFVKAATGNSKNKSQILGSQGFEAKMRSIITLEAVQNSPKKVLKILKSNYLRWDEKRDFCVELQEADQQWRFAITSTERTVQAQDREELSIRDRVKKIIVEQGLLDKSCRELPELLEAKYNIKAGKSLIGKVQKEIRASNRAA